MYLETARVTDHRNLSGRFWQLTLSAPRIAGQTQPGQFVHVALEGPEERTPRFSLRRPFSVFQADGPNVVLLYKVVGEGTRAMTRWAPGDEVSLLGPLGRPFPPVPPETQPVLVAGGYGVAALYLLAARAARRGIAFLGAQTAAELVGAEALKALGWEVCVTTEDGSRGLRGRVTEALDAWLSRREAAPEPAFYACGPASMLRAVGERAQRGGWRAWVSLDRHLGCGVGACLACVQKVRAPNGGWTWARVCRDGPVFECRELIWEDGAE